MTNYVGVSLAAVIGFLPLMTAQATAQMSVWANSGTDYGDAANWGSGVPGAGGHAEFLSSGSPTIVLGGAFQTSDWHFFDGDFDVTGGSITLGVGSSPYPGYEGLHVDGGASVAISTTIAGDAPVVVRSGSRLTLSGSNTYTGDTTISGGTLIAAHDNALGSAATATTVNAGATLGVQGDITSSEMLSLSGTGVDDAGALRNISGINTFYGAITLISPGVRINSDGGYLFLAGEVSGADTLATFGGAGGIVVEEQRVLVS